MPQFYSRTYLKPSAPLEDSLRLRNRVYALLEDLACDHRKLSNEVRKILGYQVTTFRGVPFFSEWLNKCQIYALLDFMTLFSELFKNRLIDGIPVPYHMRRILNEEFMAYEMTEDGSIRPRVDQAFAFEVESTISHLGQPRYAHVRAEFELGQKALTPINPNWTQATRHTFSAVENLFKQMFERHPRLGGKELTESLRPALERRYASAPSLVKSEANKMLNAFREWVDAVHFERHAPGTEEVHTIPTEIGTLLVSQGASYLRWLIEIDIYLQALSSKDT